MMNELYCNELRLMLNYFQPSVKLIERRRVGSRVRRVFDKPKTPFERLIELNALSSDRLAAMRAERDAVDPVALAAAIEHKVARVLRGLRARARANAARLKTIGTHLQRRTRAELPGMQLRQPPR